MIPLEAVLFDFEGTLVDFQWRLKQAVNKVLKTLEDAGFATDSYGSTPNYAEIYNQSAQLAATEGISSDGLKMMEIIDSIYDSYDADALSRWQLYPGTVEALQQLESDGYRSGLVSNVGSRSLNKALNSLGLMERFQVVISRNDVAQLKPHPEGLLKAANALQIKSDNTIFVGDSINDLRAARAAGMLSCYLFGGEHPAIEGVNFNADFKIKSIGQIPLLLKKMVQ